MKITYLPPKNLRIKPVILSSVSCPMKMTIAARDGKYQLFTLLWCSIWPLSMIWLCRHYNKIWIFSCD